MSTDAEVVITRLVACMGKMARREFSEYPFGNSPFEISFPLEGDDPERAEAVCQGLNLGLSKEFGPSPVSAIIEDSHYKVRIARQEDGLIDLRDS
ncbi:hypothetical protein ACIPV9_11530 [Pseudomonas psychrophila]|uniref:hypothetical protein n=1 Tax=Pseudomonas psychrophila TaxID=122355 RepID=UPI0010563AD3